MTDDEIVHLWDTHVNSPTAKYPLTEGDKIAFARAILASQAKQAVQPPEFQEVSWGVDSVMRPCKSMAISEYAFRRWAETNGIALALPAPIEQITPENTNGVNTVVAPQPWDNAAAYEAWLLRHWPNNAQARAIYHNEMNTRAAFVAGAEWERTRGVSVVYGSNEPRPPCTVCAKPFSEHGSYPTCATHPYTADGTCQYVLGAACVGAECKGGCVRARGVNPSRGGEHV